MNELRYCCSCKTERDDCIKVKMSHRGHFYLCWGCRISFLKNYAKHVKAELFSTKFYKKIKELEE